MWHREPAANDLAAHNVDDDAAVTAMVAPTVIGVGIRYRGHEDGFALAHGETVEMAAVLRSQPADEGRLPQRHEAMRRAGLGEAIEQRVDEDGWSAVDGCQVVRIEIAGRIAHLGDEEGVVPFDAGELSRRDYREEEAVV